MIYTIRIRKFLWWRAFTIKGHKLETVNGVPVLTIQLIDGRQKTFVGGKIEYEVELPRAVEPAPPAQPDIQAILASLQSLGQPALPAAPRPTMRPGPSRPVDRQVHVRQSPPMNTPADPPQEEPEHHEPNEVDEDYEEAHQAAPPPRSAPRPQEPLPPRGRLEAEARTAAQSRLEDMVRGRYRAAANG